MRIIVIDDNEEKSAAIIAALEASLRKNNYQLIITTVTTLADAIRTLSIVLFDLIIIDLMLPYIPNQTAVTRAVYELLRQLRSHSGLNQATPVLGISAYPEEIASIRSEFESYGVLITSFNENGNWLETLNNSLQQITQRPGTKIDLDFLVVCALEEERKGYECTRFEKSSEAIVSGLNVKYVRRPGTSELTGAILRLNQMGLVAATYETAAALNVFKPAVVCMSGICAGFSDQTSLGQLVVASPAWEYQAGKWSKNGFEIAPLQIPLRPRTRAIIDQAIGQPTLVHHLEQGIEIGSARPRRQAAPLLAPFATGSAVIAEASRLAHIEQQHRKVAALDMETYGLYFAAHEITASVEHFFSIKCVVDFADAEKDDDLHEYGSAVSARAVELLVDALTGPRSHLD